MAQLRLGPADEVTAARCASWMRTSSTWAVGRRATATFLIVFDAGDDTPRMANLLEGLSVEVLGRMRAGRVMRKPVPVPWVSPPQGGRPPKHGKEFRFAKP
ncbi:transposase, partial [Streptomyces neyagawaensis]